MGLLAWHTKRQIVACSALFVQPPPSTHNRLLWDVRICETIPDATGGDIKLGQMGHLYIKASEIRSFAFCERAWSMESKGIPSTLEKEREAGVADHRVHGGEVLQTVALRRLSSFLLSVGLIGLLAAILWLLFR